MAKFLRQQRLLAAQDFSNVFQAPNRLSLNGLLALYRPNQFGYARLGLAIGKKAIPKAVNRNRVKRITRETFRKAAELEAIDVVIIARKGLQQRDNHELHCLLNELWQRLSRHYDE